MKNFLSAARLILLSVMVLAGCGGGGGEAPTASQMPLETAATSQAEPVGLLADVRNQALATSLNKVGIVDATSLFDWAELKYPDLFPVGSIGGELYLSLLSKQRRVFGGRRRQSSCSWANYSKQSAESRYLG